MRRKKFFWLRHYSQENWNKQTWRKSGIWDEKTSGHPEQRVEAFVNVEMQPMGFVFTKNCICHGYFPGSFA